MKRRRGRRTAKKDSSGAQVSGLYIWERSREEVPSVPPISAERMELRLDVDGHTPLKTGSGTVWKSISKKFHWIARPLMRKGQDRWKGMIWYRDGETALFPYDAVEIHILRGASSSERRARVTFSKGGSISDELNFKFRSPYFHDVNFEFDYLEDQKNKVTTKIDTWAHPIRPRDLPKETLTIRTVFERAGFSVSVSPGGEVPISYAGANKLWNDAELHDAMQKYWSRYAPKAQWALWVFFASLYENLEKPGQGNSNYYGVMFDHIGEQQRQGAAIFNDSRMSKRPDTDANAWVNRNKFFWACHEMGHCFNLAHSCEKRQEKETPWIQLENEPEARSFMIDSFSVVSAEAFFADFRYRFSDSELLFMRHAPSSFVEMGNAAWFDNYGFQEVLVSPEPCFRLELRVNRNKAIFEFMEPITLELKLTNISGQAIFVEKDLLSMFDLMSVIIKREGRAARQFIPFARYELDSPKDILKPDESLYESLFVSAGNNGWDLADPGDYCVQVALHHDGQDFLSNKLNIRVLPPRSFEEEHIAQDFFSNDVGRVISFDGSCFLEKANDVLRDVAERLKEQKVAMHASVALGHALSRDFKQLVEKDQTAGPRFGIETRKAMPEEVKKLLTPILTPVLPPGLISSKNVAAESLGHIDYKWYVDQFVAFLAREGEKNEAIRSQEVLYQTLSQRVVQGRGVLKKVLEEIEKRLKELKKK